MLLSIQFYVDVSPNTYNSIPCTNMKKLFQGTLALTRKKVAILFLSNLYFSSRVPKSSLTTYFIDKLNVDLKISLYVCAHIKTIP